MGNATCMPIENACGDMPLTVWIAGNCGLLARMLWLGQVWLNLDSCPDQDRRRGQVPMWTVQIFEC